MKAALAFAGFAVCGFASNAFGQAALPAGLYEINGTVTAISGTACPLTTQAPVSGHIYYPGVGFETTEIVLESVNLGKTVTVAVMSAFPPVPASGLNGWTSSSPASPNYTQSQNGTLTGGGTAANLSFDLVYNGGKAPLFAFAQGTFSIAVDSIGPCTETVQALFTRVAPFYKSKQ